MTQFVSYAQNREDVILQAYLKDVKNGTYVDIGAHHPVDDSVTKHFYDQGWRGINVEPNETMYALLCENRPEDTNVQAGISDKQGELKLRIYANSGLSTFTPEIKEQYQAHTDAKTRKYKDTVVRVMTLADLFAEYPLGHIHFMKVDVEGYEYQVLAGNDWKKYRPEVICIEADHQVKDWRPILVDNNYTFVWNDGLNDYYLANESSHRAANFYYPETMLLSEQILPHHVVKVIGELDEARNEEQLKRQILNLKVDYLADENTQLNHKIADQQRIRNASKTLAIAVDKAIRHHIEAIKYKQKKSTGPRLKDIVIAADDVSASELLGQLQTADLASHYSTRGIVNLQPSLVRKAAYQVAKGTYYVPRKLVSSSYKFARARRRSNR